jgi:two-component system sensor kinase FixL
MVLPLRKESTTRVVSVAASLVILIAIIDLRVVENIPLGFLYLIPMLMLGRVLKPWQTVVAAGVLTLLTEEFDPFVWDVRTGMPRDVLYFVAFLAIGIFVHDSTRNRKAILRQLREIERQSDAREDAEEQLRVLIASSPAAIVTTDSEGCILIANEAAYRMLGIEPATLPGRSLRDFLPGLANIAQRENFHPMFRSVMQSRGVRADGETFVAEICFSTYVTKSGPRLAAMILDTSEELRSREESSLHQVLSGSRIAVVAVSYEIRNVCCAIGVVHQNLARDHELGKSKDFEALGNLVLALERIAGVDLLQYPESNEKVDLQSVLDDLKIVISPALSDASIACGWKVEPKLPLVWANRTSLMQIFLNLTNNSIRALDRTSIDRRSMIISAFTHESPIIVRVVDNGGGVVHPEELFHPFQAGAHATGLGLYLSRAFARACGGDLRYEEVSGHACFVVEFPVATGKETE